CNSQNGDAMKKKLRLGTLAKEFDSQPAAPLALVREEAPTRQESRKDVKTERQLSVKPAKRPEERDTEVPAAGAKRKGARKEQPLFKMTIKIDPEVRRRLLAESYKRKGEGLPTWPVQEIVTEAVNAYLGK